jgi:hypothetical protein
MMQDLWNNGMDLNEINISRHAPRAGETNLT